MPTTRSLSAGAVNLEVSEAGAGGRPLMLVHGFTGARDDFVEWLDELAAKGWHAVAPDLRGHGGSEQPRGDAAYSLADFAADIVGLADTLGWSRFTLLGHSMGGMAAQHVVLDHPQRVEALVLMDTTHGPVDWIDPGLRAFGAAVVREQGMAALMELQNAQRDLDPLQTAAFRRLLAERPGYAELCDRKLLASSPDMWLAMSAELTSQADRLDRLARIAVPTLVIVGDQDEPFVPHAERMAEAIPGAQLAVIAGAGHSPQFESPDAWWTAVSSFLDGLAQDAA